MFDRTCSSCKTTYPLLKSHKMKVGYYLCEDCYKLIHPTLSDFATDHWTHAQYEIYKDWYDKICQREFIPTFEYGTQNILKIDTINNLFSINGLVMEFRNIIRYSFDFEPRSIKNNILGSKVEGQEKLTLIMKAPVYHDIIILRPAAKLKTIRNGNTVTPILSEHFTEIATAFNLEYEKARYYIPEDFIENEPIMAAGNLEKALALFMFDDILDVTPENLKTQRNNRSVQIPV